MMQYDVIIIGAGPCGLSCGIEAQKRNLNYLVIDKGNITESIRRYPVNMVFFSTSENIEIGNVPFVSMGMRPNRTEALKYYRKVVDHYQLNLSLFTLVDSIVPEGSEFVVKTNKGEFTSKKIVLSTGYYDVPKFLNIPGEDLPHVSHYYDEAFKYTQTKTVVVGGANSAVETALDLYRNGAKVTVVHIFDDIDKNAKYWIVPDLKNRIKKNEVEAFFNTRVKSIQKDKIELENLHTKEITFLEADFVFLMTGYRPDANFLQKIGIQLNGENLIPQLDPQTFESNIKGIYMAGSIIGGEETAKVFIENGRHHAVPVMDSIASSL